MMKNNSNNILFFCFTSSALYGVCGLIPNMTNYELFQTIPPLHSFNTNPKNE